MDNYDVLKKLLGPIDPIGSTDVDAERYKNLEATIDVVNRLLFDIDAIVWKNKNPQEHSIIKAKEKASEFCRELRDSLLTND